MILHRAVALSLAILSCSLARSQQTSQDQVVQTANAWLQGVSKGDRAALNSIMDSRFIATTPIGDVLTKDRLVPDDESKAVQTLPLMALDAPMVRLYGDTAVLMSRLKPLEGNGTMNGTFVFRRDSNSWKLVALHLSAQR